ncbi:MAG: hypothetical protein AAF503_02140 [Pseudomonadota bacterium]
MSIVVSLGSLEESMRHHPAPAGRVALSLDGECIGLHHEGADGKWSDVGKAAFDDGDFAKQIEWLRVEALARTGRQQPVMIWLKDDHVLERNFPISARNAAARRNLAADLFAEETAYRRDELEIAVGSTDENGLATCLAILRQTRLEAQEHLARWGFEPGPVTIAEPMTDGTRFPSFERCEQGGRRAARIGARMATIGLGVIGTGGLAAAAVWGIAVLMQNPSPVPVTVSAAIAFPMVIEKHDEAAQLATTLDADMARARVMPALALRHPDPAPGNLERLAPHDHPWLARYVPPESFAQPRTVTRSESFEIGKAGTVEELPLQLASLDRSPNGFAAANGPARGESLAISGSGDPTWFTGSNRLAVSPYDRAQEPVLASLAAVADAPLTAPLPFPRAPVGRFSTALAPSSTALNGPGGLTLQPIPRPRAASAPPAIETGPDVTTGLAIASQGPDSRPGASLEPGVSLPLPEPITGGTPAQAGKIPVAFIESVTVEPLAAENVQTEAETELVAALAIPSSPLPQPRPERRSHKIATTRELVPRTLSSDGPVSRAVGKAAQHNGIPLDRTSLVGIINMTSGREALLRLPSGGFRRVGRGDDVAGWQVSMIGHDAMQLSQGTRRRTLLLVGR